MIAASRRQSPSSHCAARWLVRWRMLALALGLIVGLDFDGSAAAATWEVKISPRPNENFDHAEFRLWIDDRTADAPTPKLRTLLILAPGWNGDGRSLATDPAWQNLARQLDAAIVAVHLRTDLRDDDDPRRYHRADQGSGAALVRALEFLARDARRPEIARLPWLAWGHSAGGQWAYGLANVYPERTGAFVAIKGGLYETSFDPRVRAIPGLFVVGEHDDVFRANNITTLFERERRAGALWAVAWESDAGHEIGRSTELARAYLLEAAKLRVPPPSEEPARLRVARADAGHLGYRADYSVHEARLTEPPDLARTVWLPGAESARLWRELGDSR